MKLTPFLTKIAASLFIAAKAVKGQQCDGMPDSIASLPDAYFSAIKQTWCDLLVSDPTGGEATLFTLMVGAALVADPSGAFFSTCLQDVIDGMKFQQLEQYYTAQGIELEGPAYSRYQCDDTKTKVEVLSTATNDNWRANGFRQFVNPWLLYVCKSASCDTDTLNQVLNSITLEYYTLGGNPYPEGTIISDTVTPSVECYRNQIGYSIINSELYCSGESAPVCSNKKLIEVQLGTDAPFELAVCDDNDCLASLGDTRPISNLADGFGPSNPFCLPVESYRAEFSTIEITILEKEFNLSDYCSAAAASGRTGRCETPIPTQAPTVKVVASETETETETESAPAESAAWMRMESFVLKCCVGLLPLLLL